MVNYITHYVLHSVDDTKGVIALESEADTRELQRKDTDIGHVLRGLEIVHDKILQERRNP